MESERAEFCKAEIALGFAPPFGGSQRLPQLIGRKRALRMILTAEPITAAQARDFGLVNEVVPNAQLLDAAFALAAGVDVGSGALGLFVFGLATTPGLVALALGDISETDL